MRTLRTRSRPGSGRPGRSWPGSWPRPPAEEVAVVRLGDRASRPERRLGRRPRLPDRPHELGAGRPSLREALRVVLDDHPEAAVFEDPAGPGEDHGLRALGVDLHEAYVGAVPGGVELEVLLHDLEVRRERLEGPDVAPWPDGPGQAERVVADHRADVDGRLAGPDFGDDYLRDLLLVIIAAAEPEGVALVRHDVAT